MEGVRLLTLAVGAADVQGNVLFLNVQGMELKDRIIVLALEQSWYSVELKDRIVLAL